MDNGITTTAQGSLSTHVTAASGGSVTSVVTTGPDGASIDEGSQQSTLSNASAGRVLSFPLQSPSIVMFLFNFENVKHVSYSKENYLQIWQWSTKYVVR